MIRPVLAFLGSAFLFLAGVLVAAEAQDKPNLQMVLQLGHSESVESIAFSPDGRQVVTGSRDKALRLWDVATGRLLRTLRGHTDEVSSVKFSPDGHQLLSGSNDNTLKLWDGATGQLLRTFEGHSDQITSSVAFSPDGRQVLSGSSDYTLKLWDVSTGQRLKTLMGHTNFVTSVAFSSDGHQALSGSLDGIVKLWDLATGQATKSFELHKKEVLSVAFSPDGHQALSYGNDNKINLWDIATGQIIKIFEGQGINGGTAVFSSDGRQIISIHRDNKLKIWDIETGQVLKTFGDNVEAFAVSPDGRFVLLAERYKTLELWDAVANQHLKSFDGGQASANSVAFSPDSNKMLIVINEKETPQTQILNLWSFERGSVIKSNIWKNANMTEAVFSPDGQQILSVHFENTVSGTYNDAPPEIIHSANIYTLHDAASGQVLKTIREEAPSKEGQEGLSDYGSIAFSVDGRRAFFGGARASLLDIEAGKHIKTFQEQTVFSPDGRQALSRSRDGKLTLWDADTGKLLRTFAGTVYDSTMIAFSPDGQKVIAGGENSTLKLWDVKTGKLTKTFTGQLDKSFDNYTEGSTAVAFSPDGRTVFLGDVDATIKQWDVATGKLLKTMKGHSARVDEIGFTSGGHKMYSGSSDETKLWDVATGQMLQTFEQSSLITKDGRLVASIDPDGTVLLRNAQTGELLVTLVFRVGGEWLVITPAGFFDASTAGAESVHFVRGLEVIPVGRAAGHLRRPDLIQEVLKGDPEGKYKDAVSKLKLGALLDGSERRASEPK